MTAQSLLKHLLTEGDKFILSWVSPLEDQGGYAIAVNYGESIEKISRHICNDGFYRFPRGSHCVPTY